VRLTHVVATIAAILALGIAVVAAISTLGASEPPPAPVTAIDVDVSWPSPTISPTVSPSGHEDNDDDDHSDDDHAGEDDDDD
jgi:hypothetical protein